MKRIRSQRGIIGVVALVVLVMIMVALIASYALSRLNSSTEELTSTQTRLSRARDALEQFVSGAHRLPCPANPAVDTGDEVQASSTTCTYVEGTIPWKTIGMKREEGFDGWGRKLSYRVYTNSGSGSLTQPEGASMVNCDTVETSPSLGANGVCNNPLNAATRRDTTPAQFLAGKGFSLNDMGTAYSDVAYVIISHGVSGGGGYSASGIRRDMPSGDERNNTRENGSFVIRAFSDPDVSTASGLHFDDLLVYRRLADLMTRTKLTARDWPETYSTSQLFDSATVSAAVGSTVSSGQALGTSVDFGRVTVSGFTGSTATDVNYVETTSGTVTTGAVGVAGSSTMMSSATGEYLRFDFDDKATKFAVTLSHFGTYFFFVTWIEHAEFRFYLNGSQVGSAIPVSGCRDDGGLASFSLTPSGTFDRVEIQATSATSGGSSFISQFLVAEVKACASTESTCVTGLSSASPTNTCP